jgi:hypothetical protein
MRQGDYFPCTYEKACNVLWAVQIMGWSQTRAAIVFDLNCGTVSHIVNRHRFQTATPKPPSGYRAA